MMAAAPPALFAQWLGYPTLAVPRTPDGKPNLSAPTPRIADGKPDLSGNMGLGNHRPALRFALYGLRNRVGVSEHRPQRQGGLALSALGREREGPANPANDANRLE